MRRLLNLAAERKLDVVFARIVLSAVSGVFLGVAVLVVVLTASVGLVWATGTRAYLPGLLEAWIAEENGLPAVNFVPHLPGMLVATVLVSTLTVILSHRRRGARHD